MPTTSLPTGCFSIAFSSDYFDLESNWSIVQLLDIKGAIVNQSLELSNILLFLTSMSDKM